MALLGTLIDTQTVACAATASTTFTHAIGAAPDAIISMASYSTVSLATEFPYLAVSLGSVSVTIFNRGKVAETVTACTARFHSIIR